MEAKSHEAGTFSWFELATSDANRAKAFYTELFGWKPNDVPMGASPEDGVYTMLLKDGLDVAALYPMRQQQREEGVPPNWLSYVTVEKVDESARRARDLGGTVLSEPFDVMGVGRMSVVRDPTGAVLALWEARASIGARRINETGAACWSELATRDTAAAEKFYTRLFGWKPKTSDYSGAPYTEFLLGERSVAGMMQIRDEWGPMPPCWAVYFGVQSCDESTSRAQRLGGRVLTPPTDIPGIGRFSIIQDPLGATFSTIQAASSS
jgi:predicted enzyme related to lactoylglutathione lyase